MPFENLRSGHPPHRRTRKGTLGICIAELNFCICRHSRIGPNTGIRRPSRVLVFARIQHNLACLSVELSHQKIGEFSQAAGNMIGQSQAGA